MKSETLTLKNELKAVLFYFTKTNKHFETTKMYRVTLLTFRLLKFLVNFELKQIRNLLIIKNRSMYIDVFIFLWFALRTWSA